MLGNKTLLSVTENDLFLLDDDPTRFWKNINKIADFAFKGLDIKHIDIPNGVNEICSNAFANCIILRTVNLPKNLKIISSEAFINCESLSSISIPQGVKKLCVATFKNCRNLSNVIIPETCISFEALLFKNCTNLLDINLPKKLKSLPFAVFENCSSLKYIDMPPFLETIGNKAFANCVNLESMDIPHGVEQIDSFAFMNCESLELINVPKSVVIWGKNVFKNCPTNYVGIHKDGSFTISKNPLPDSKYDKVIDISNCRKNIMDFDLNGDLVATNLSIYAKLADVAAKNGFVITSNLVAKLKFAHKIDDFCKSNFKLFNQIQKFIPNDCSENNMTAILTFAYDIGCFSNNPKLAQRATEWLKERFVKKEIDVINFMNVFSDWPTKGDNIEFSEFLFSNDKNSNIPVFKQLQYESKYGDLLKKIYAEYVDPDADLRPGGRFRDARGRLRFAVVKESVNANGEMFSRRKDLVPTVETFKNYFAEIAFSGIMTDEDKQIAAELAKWSGLKQENFGDAKKIMREYHENSVPANILGFHLRDLNADIESYKIQTQELAKEGVECAQEILNKISSHITKDFSYDWLEKNDPMNFCLGLYCSCCAHLGAVGYGIMRANFVRSDIQNLVIKTKNGTPVAKSTMFLNREQGYAVFNTIRVAFSMSDAQREEIYDEFLLGVSDFANAYNQKNPQKPLKIMTVGMHVNDLKEQIQKTKQKCKSLQAIDFGMYGTYLQDYEGDWNYDEGQYKIWEQNEAKEGNRGRRL